MLKFKHIDNPDFKNYFPNFLKHKPKVDFHMKSNPTWVYISYADVNFSVYTHTTISLYGCAYKLNYIYIYIYIYVCVCT